MGNKIDGRMHFIAKNNMNYTRNLSCKRSWKDFEFNDLFTKTHFFSFSQHKLLIFFLKCNKIPNANNLNSDFHHYHFKNASPFSYAISRFTFHISHIFSSLLFKSNQIIYRFVVHFAWEPIHRYATISLDSYQFLPPFAFSSTSNTLHWFRSIPTVSLLPNALIAFCLFRFPNW